MYWCVTDLNELESVLDNDKDNASMLGVANIYVVRLVAPIWLVVVYMLEQRHW